MDFVAKLKAFLLAQRASRFPTLAPPVATLADALIPAVVDVAVYYVEEGLKKVAPNVEPVVAAALEAK